MWEFRHPGAVVVKEKSKAETGTNEERSRKGEDGGAITWHTTETTRSHPLPPEFLTFNFDRLRDDQTTDRPCCPVPKPRYPFGRTMEEDVSRVDEDGPRWPSGSKIGSLDCTKAVILFVFVVYMLVETGLLNERRNALGVRNSGGINLTGISVALVDIDRITLISNLH